MESGNAGGQDVNAVIASGMQDMFKYCHAPFVEACRGRGPAGTKDPEFINNTNEVLREGYDLLKEHFVSSGIVGAVGVMGIADFVTQSIF